LAPEHEVVYGSFRDAPFTDTAMVAPDTEFTVP